MKTFYEIEQGCTMSFCNLGPCYHIWTPENFEIIFTSEENFMAGMDILAVCSKSFSQIEILTFELMSNHIHIAAAGKPDALLKMFNLFKVLLMRYFSSINRMCDWKRFVPGMRELKNLDEVRNVIVYINRNGFVVTPDSTPFSYPWGCNRYYFNNDAKRLASSLSSPMTFRRKRETIKSHRADKDYSILSFDGYALPTSFCAINSGELLFRNASHYFHKLSRSIETNKQIAKDISESIFYTDDELFSLITKIAKESFSCETLSKASPQEKLELTRIMRFEYNASAKQIQRMLRLEAGTLSAMGIT